MIFNGRNSGQHLNTGVTSTDIVVRMVYVVLSPDKLNRFECTCLPGFEPKSPRNWYLREGYEGCVRKQSGMSMCGNGEGFVKVDHAKGPDSSNATWMNMSSSECQQACLSNCNCTAFFNMNKIGRASCRERV